MDNEFQAIQRRVKELGGVLEVEVASGERGETLRARVPIPATPRQ